jgi:hypothetical protein
MLCCASARICCTAENVARHKPYEQSPVPNYSCCNDSGDKAQLTEALCAVSPSNMMWSAEKDHTAMDAVLIRALDQLEESIRGGK